MSAEMNVELQEKQVHSKRNNFQFLCSEVTFKAHLPNQF